MLININLLHFLKSKKNIERILKIFWNMSSFKIKFQNSLWVPHSYGFMSDIFHKHSSKELHWHLKVFVIQRYTLKQCHANKLNADDEYHSESKSTCKQNYQLFSIQQSVCFVELRRIPLHFPASSHPSVSLSSWPHLNLHGSD